MDLKELFKQLEEKYWTEAGKKYYVYVSELLADTKQAWAKSKDVAYFILQYEKVKQEWLVIDWKHITLWYRGITYDYVAFKNKMLLAYPESIIDINLVYKDDKFNFKKESGKVIYTHEFANPFDKEEKNITGWYCIIKNKRGEFITLLSEVDFQTHKNVATTKNIWNTWYAEMRLKTLFRKAIKVHYDDIFEQMEVEDNKEYDLKGDKNKSELDNIANDLINESKSKSDT